MMTVAGPFAAMETARLWLRCVAPEDAAATSALMTEPVARWLASWPTPFTQEFALQRIEDARAAARRNDMLACAITLKETGQLAGWMIVARCEGEARRGALGYWLGEPYQGQGFGREALAALLSNGFGLLDLDMIEAGAQPENAGSFAVMRACGMRQAGSRMVYAPARGRDELCLFYEIRRSGAV
jgi:ribosomal-protein-alanine N-acetyltransferase